MEDLKIREVEEYKLKKISNFELFIKHDELTLEHIQRVFFD